MRLTQGYVAAGGEGNQPVFGEGSGLRVTLLRILLGQLDSPKRVRIAAHANYTVSNPRPQQRYPMIECANIAGTNYAHVHGGHVNDRKR
jgi:hypothetical protein